MRVMLDTNILYSAFVFPNSVSNRLLRSIADNYPILLSTATLAEMTAVVLRKEPGLLTGIDTFLMTFPYETIYTPAEITETELFKIRDPKDYKILYSAIIGMADVFVTGDKDFMEVQIDFPEICTPRDFILKYLS